MDTVNANDHRAEDRDNDFQAQPDGAGAATKRRRDDKLDGRGQGRRRRRRRRDVQQGGESVQLAPSWRVTDDTDACAQNGCTVCFDVMTHSGAHRVVSLVCGHLFGLQCIDRWLAKRATCPQCNKKASRKDIRPVYLRNVVVVDNKLVEDAKRKARQIEQDRDHWRLQAETRQTLLDSITEQIDSLRAENQRLRQEMSSLQSLAKYARPRTVPQPPPPQVDPGPSSQQQRQLPSPATPTASQQMARLLQYQFRLRFNLERGARAFDFERSRRCVVASKMLPDGHGALAQLSIHESTNSYPTIRIHSKQIRDVQCGRHRADGLVASASLDRTVALTSLDAQSRVQSWTLNAPVWSCCWDDVQPHVLYAGLANGSLVSLDLRRTDKPMSSIRISDGKALHSLHSIKANTSCDNLQAQAHVVAGTLGNVYLHNPETQKTSAGAAPFGSGQCFSSCIDFESQHVLASFRQSDGSGQASATHQHHVYGIDTEAMQLYSVHRHTVPSSTVHMARTDFFSKRLPNERRLFIASVDDRHSGAHLYDPTVTHASIPIPFHLPAGATPSPILQIKRVLFSTGDYLGCLNESHLCLYREGGGAGSQAV